MILDHNNNGRSEGESGQESGPATICRSIFLFQKQSVPELCAIYELQMRAGKNFTIFECAYCI